MLEAGVDVYGSARVTSEADPPSSKSSSLFRSLGSVFTGSIFIVSSQIASMWLAAHVLDQGGFTDYILSKRLTAVVVPTATLGLGVALTREVAITSTRAAEARMTSLVSVLLLIALTLIIAGSLVLMLGDTLALAAFGEPRRTDLVWATAAGLPGQLLSGIAYAYERGRMTFHRASVGLAFTVGGLPLLGFVAGGASATRVLLYTAGFSSLVSAAWLAELLRSEKLILSASGLLKHAQNLASFGIVRVPGDFLTAAFVAFPAFACVHLGSLKDGGNVGFATTVLGLSVETVGPIGILLLPHASRLVGDGHRLRLKRQIRLLVAAAIGIPGVIAFVGWFVLDWLVTWYLGPSNSAAAQASRLMLLSGPAYGIFMVVRNAVDAASRRPLNTYNLAIAMCCCIAATLLLIASSSAVVASTLGFCAGTCVLAILTLRTVARELSGEAPL